MHNGQKELDVRHFLRTQRITPTMKMRKKRISMIIDSQVAMPAEGLSWRPSEGGGKVTGIGDARSSEKEVIINIAALLK